jgi:DNA mismatch repair protein MutL
LSDSKFAEFLGQHYVPGDALPASLAGGLAAGLHASAQTGQIPAVLATVAPGLAPVSILQVHDKYVITADASGIVIIDQHALHERVMFEKLLVRITRGPLESQPLLTPVPVATTRDAIAMLPILEPLLTRLGLTLAPLGPATVGVQSVPTLLIERSIDIAMFAAELLEKALRGELEADAPGASPATRTQHEHAIRDVLDMMACKAAIKAGDKLSEAELRELLRLRETVERSSNCPHGRPTSMRVSLRELDRLFGRG